MDRALGLADADQGPGTKVLHGSPRGKRMDFEELVQTRRSVRGFSKKPVPRPVIEQILDVAKRAPSSMNTQPWHGR